MRRESIIDQTIPELLADDQAGMVPAMAWCVTADDAEQQIN